MRRRPPLPRVLCKRTWKFREAGLVSKLQAVSLRPPKLQLNRQTITALQIVDSVQGLRAVADKMYDETQIIKLDLAVLGTTQTWL